ASPLTFDDASIYDVDQILLLQRTELIEYFIGGVQPSKPSTTRSLMLLSYRRQSWYLCSNDGLSLHFGSMFHPVLLHEAIGCPTCVRDLARSASLRERSSEACRPEFSSTTEDPQNEQANLQGTQARFSIDAYCLCYLRLGCCRTGKYSLQSVVADEGDVVE